mmetsp:Transcript_56719/g.165992  ORF Transcript_56719/g.165992 Transcript_56719/m.165992 type:complete len:312 (+) Transcript_56719:44-979(+)
MAGPRLPSVVLFLLSSKSAIGNRAVVGETITDMFNENNLLLTRLNDPTAMAIKAVKGEWTDISATFFGRNVTKFAASTAMDVLAKAIQVCLGACGGSSDTQETPVKDSAQQFFHRGEWYLLLNAREATRNGAMGCPVNINSKQHGPYAPEMRKPDGKTLVDPRKTPRTVVQGQALIRWAGGARSDNEELRSIDKTYVNKKQREHFDNLHLNVCFPCDDAKFASLQQFMTTAAPSTKQWNEVYLPGIDDKAIVALMHESQVFQEGQEATKADNRAILSMSERLESILHRPIPIFGYKKSEGKYLPVEVHPAS